jgi:hypothetical protein
VGVTSIVAGTNISVSGPTGAVTVNASAYPLTIGSAVATTSGTSITVTGIPSWAKKVTVALAGVSTNGGSNVQMRLGTSSGIDNTANYSGSNGYSGNSNSNSIGGSASNNGLGLWFGNSSSTVSGTVTITNITGNTWIMSSLLGDVIGTVFWHGCYSKSLSAALTQIQISTDNGTDVFDAGTLNILYE